MKLEELQGMSQEQIVAAFAAVEQETAELSEGKAAAENLVKKYEQQTLEAKDAARKAQNEAWIKSVAEGAEPRMLPTERPFATYLLDVLTAPEGTQVKAYTEKVKVKEGDKEVEKDVELTPVVAFQRLYELRNKAVVAQLFTEISVSASTAGSGEPALPKTPEEAKEVAVARAKEYAKAHEGTPFAKAYRAVLDADPDLKQLAAGIRPEGEAAAREGSARMAQLVAPR